MVKIPKNNITEELELEIISYYLDNHSKANTVSYFGISERSFREIIKKHGIKKDLNQTNNTIKATRLKNLNKPTIELQKQIIECYQQSGWRLTIDKFHLLEKDLRWVLAVNNIKRNNIRPEKQKVKAVKKLKKSKLTDTLLIKQVIEAYLKPNTAQEVAKQFNLAYNSVLKILQENNIPKHTPSVIAKFRQESYKDTCRKKYDCDNTFQVAKYKEKSKSTILERYGTEHAMQADAVKEKFKQTCLEKYGVENAALSSGVRNKIRQEACERYNSTDNFIEITPIVEYDIINYYRDHSARQTINKFCIRLSNLNNILKAHNIKRHLINKTILTVDSISEIIRIYPITSDCAICRQFHITKAVLKNLLKTNNIKSHTEFENRRLANITIISEQQELELIEFYKTNSMTATCAKFKTNKDNITNILVKNSISLHTSEESKRIKSNKQSIKKQEYFKNLDVKKLRAPSRKIYNYDNQSFDSSWELCFWIWAKDHKKNITRIPKKIMYKLNDRTYYYFPDFLYEGKLIEIKGDHLLKNNKLYNMWRSNTEYCEKLNAKYDCMKANNVNIWTFKDVKFALDYVKQTYGTKYLKQFKV